GRLGYRAGMDAQPRLASGGECGGGPFPGGCVAIDKPFGGAPDGRGRGGTVEEEAGLHSVVVRVRVVATIAELERPGKGLGQDRAGVEGDRADEPAGFAAGEVRVGRRPGEERIS